MAEHKTEEGVLDEPIEVVVPEVVELPVDEEVSVPAEKEVKRPTRDRRGDRDRSSRRGGPRREERRSEFGQKLIGIRRVARVMAGGRRFNFSAALVLGDKKGRVGVGLGKAADTALAIEKATRHAKRGMLTLNLTKTQSIPHNVSAKYCASVVEIRPSPGRGLVAGSSVRSVLELAGVRDVTAKLLSRSKNPINNARAAMEALKQIAK
ncbi:MAG: 30S ribosomal protein S5 [Parcubacteria group bacterium GW2011_GWA2_51_10]|nr:MAG: 30S ribosomal protein S5 [Parcubacteria group bacterium GW2011_GWA2_51_10]